MKSTLLNSIWAVSLLASVAMPIRLAAQEQSGKVKECSNATLQGSFGYTSTGTLVDFPPPLRALSLRSVGRPSTGEVTRRNGNHKPKRQHRQGDDWRHVYGKSGL